MVINSSFIHSFFYIQPVERICHTASFSCNLWLLASGCERIISLMRTLLPENAYYLKKSFSEYLLELEDKSAPGDMTINRLVLIEIWTNNAKSPPMYLTVRSSTKYLGKFINSLAAINEFFYSRALLKNMHFLFQKIVKVH